MAKETKSKEFDVAYLEEIFQLADKNADGFISEDELAYLLRVDMGRNLSDAAIKAMFCGVDADGDGMITLKEFVLEMTKPKRRCAFEAAFRRYDKDGNGVLTPDEIFRMCREVGAYSEEDIQRMIRACDKNGDGQICYDEFMALV